MPGIEAAANPEAAMPIPAVILRGGLEPSRLSGAIRSADRGGAAGAPYLACSQGFAE